MKILVGVSNRHCHLTEDTYVQLFGNNKLEKHKDLVQPGEFASTSKIIIKKGDREIKEVRVLGPFRDYDQVEISKTDAYKLKINPPVRRSGDLLNSETVALIGPRGMGILTEGVIIANRHIHFSIDDAKKFGVEDNQLINVKVGGIKGGSMHVRAKIQNPSVIELHIDTDDANSFLLTTGDEVEADI